MSGSGENRVESAGESRESPELGTHDVVSSAGPESTIGDTTRSKSSSVPKRNDSHPSARISTHLPTPTPSPRSTSPFLVITDASPTEWTIPMSAISNGHSHTNSFEEAGTMPPTIGGENGESHVASSTSKASPTRELHDIPEEMTRRRRKSSLIKASGDERIFKLTAEEIQELTSSPESLPHPTPRPSVTEQTPTGLANRRRSSNPDFARSRSDTLSRGISRKAVAASESSTNPLGIKGGELTIDTVEVNRSHRRRGSSRTIFIQPDASTRMAYARSPSFQTSRKSVNLGFRPEPLDFDLSKHKSTPNGLKSPLPDIPLSPLPQSIPLPPMSIPTYLQLELADSKPSPLYIYRPPSTDRLYESSKVKFERLLNFLLVAPQLEQVLVFGSLACLDAWLYTFTILPLRFLKAAAILVDWWGEVLAKEARFILEFIYYGSGRMWSRRRESIPRSRRGSLSSRPLLSTASSFQSQSGRYMDTPNHSHVSEHSKTQLERKSRGCWSRKRRHSKSQPSSLNMANKADLLQGAVIICSCIILMELDASRMYHNIKAQSTIKLYVIYNGLEVCDKLLAALGQDIFECLFSDATLERDSDGRSRLLRPLGMFFLALIYNVIHASALFYQVITLNVAVNSYSNALLTLLLSNQFVEIKSSVFKKIEKENLFQMTCADIIERFQLWLMLIIIGLRNIVEVGGLSLVASSTEGASETLKNATRINSLLPNSFTILPSWSGEVLSPFLIVVGSEMLVDSVKHAYVSKFNNVKPAIYQRYLDVLAKDYYTNAFHSQNLIKRLGLPTIPLSCLFIRASLQTYHMFLATHFSPPIPSPSPSSSTSLSDPSISASATTTAALEHFDTIIRKALGADSSHTASLRNFWQWSTDDVLAKCMMVVLFLGAFLLLLVLKVGLGMVLLRVARGRYRGTVRRERELAKAGDGEKAKEKESYDTGGRRLGGWGTVEVDEEKKRWIYGEEGDGVGKGRFKERDGKEKEKEKGAGSKGVAEDLDRIIRYEMSGKRIW